MHIEALLIDPGPAYPPFDCARMPFMKVCITPPLCWSLLQALRMRFEPATRSSTPESRHNLRCTRIGNHADALIGHSFRYHPRGMPHRDEARLQQAAPSIYADIVVSGCCSTLFACQCRGTRRFRLRSSAITRLRIHPGDPEKLHHESRYEHRTCLNARHKNMPRICDARRRSSDDSKTRSRYPALSSRSSEGTGRPIHVPRQPLARSAVPEGLIPAVISPCRLTREDR
jgi:hypothetical protein